ncbi:MAG: hypothetical protein EBX41_11200, partial [Chitinophagia bacterium]|nr:hypothetical protein [Chitinophagia bacterium]
MNKYLHTLLFILTPSLLFAQYCSPAYLTYGLTSGVMARFAANGSGSSFINDSLPASSVTSGYVARVTSVPALNVVQGRNYSCTIIYYSPASATGNQIFIDFDNNNVFDVGEEVSTVEPATYAFGTSTPYATLNIYIPPSAALGTHRMRVRNVGYNISSSAGFGSANFDACADRDATNQYYKGVTADYLVNISTASSCSGSPYAGDITGVSSICQNTPFSLNLINDSVALGLEYQWFSRPVGSGTMTAISGATNRVYNVGLQSVSTIYQAMV